MARTTKRRARHSKAPPLSQKVSIKRKIREILGASSRSSLGSFTLEDATRAQLLEIGGLLGIQGVSRLRKGELADRVRLALRTEKSPPARRKAASAGTSQAEEPSAEPSKPSSPVATPSVEHGWSRAEFQARKFSLDDPMSPSSQSAARSSLPKTIPWGYGRTRVGALPVDPERLFVYWEVTDEVVEEARRALGPGGMDAWLNLRIYDTTGRLFDGNNAQSFFDHGVGNASRQWFFDIGKPGSEAFVEIGLRSADGSFRKVARSGRVVFPRRAPAPYREPQWLTVRASSAEPFVARPAARPSLDSRTRKMPPDPLRFGPGTGPTDAWHTVEPGTTWVEQGTTSTVVLEQTLEFSENWRLENIWDGRASSTAWESGPFSIPLDVPEPVWETYAGEVRTFQVDGRTHIVFGPWQVVVRGIGAYGGRRVLSRWEVFRSWAIEGTGALQSAGVWGRMMGSSALLGGSERRFHGASELRLSGSSELLYRGASERRLGGASERVYAAASEKLMRGASARRFRGASERWLGGASERLGGASERLGGASERWPTWTRKATPDE
jgi:hypothetical protein